MHVCLRACVRACVRACALVRTLVRARVKVYQMLTYFVMYSELDGGCVKSY